METTELFHDEKGAYHCPFNNSHVMPHKTLALHLTKCPDRRKSSLKTCTFHNLHIVHENQLAAHEEKCPYRSVMDEIFYESPDSKRPVTVIDKAPTVVFNNDESWDEPGPSTSVLKNINAKSVCMKPSHGLTKSQRTKHRTKMSEKCSRVNLSYNENISIGQRQDLADDGTKAEQGAKDEKLFFGKRP